MVFKLAILLVAVLAGCNAIPAPQEERDMSMFFEHVDPESRIVGGTTAPTGSHPHMAAMTHGATVRAYACGGSIISSRTILTAAHCITPVLSGNSLIASLRVTVGTNFWNSGGQMHTLMRHVIAPGYDANNIKNDIGVLHTTSNIVMTNLVRTITVSYDWVGEFVRARVAGWGRTRTNGAISASLLQLDVLTIDGQRCVTDVAAVARTLQMWAPPVNRNIELCTFHSRNHGTCNGDSGSALVRTDRGQQIGIVSWGLPCAQGAPDVFVRLSAFRSFVQFNTI